MRNNYRILSISLIGLTLLTGCARNISSDNYVAGNVGEVSTTYSGTIQNVREVCVDAHDELGNNRTGTLGGLGVGGLLGSSFGRGNLFPTAAGAVVGAIGGSIIEKKLKQQQALEYIVQIENGGLLTIVQGKDVIFSIGQPVFVIVSQQGRSRIIAQ